MPFPWFLVFPAQTQAGPGSLQPARAGQALRCYWGSGQVPAPRPCCWEKPDFWRVTYTLGKAPGAFQAFSPFKNIVPPSLPWRGVKW